MYVTEYHFTECPVNFHLWTREEKLKIHGFICSKALEFSNQTPQLEFGDFYNAGFLGYLQAIKTMPWTIDQHSLPLVCKWIVGAMKDEWISWYGRGDTIKGRAKRLGLFSQASLDSPVGENGDA